MARSPLYGGVSYRPLAQASSAVSAALTHTKLCREVRTDPHIGAMRSTMSWYSAPQWYALPPPLTAGRLSFPEGDGRYLFEVPGEDPADAAGGKPVIVAMRPYERPSRLCIFCIFSSHLRLTLLRRPTVALTRSSPAIVRAPGPSPAPSPRRRWPGAAWPRPWRCPSRWTPGG